MPRASRARAARPARPSNEQLHVVLLAGGGGTRFWPASRRRRPKQMLPLSGSGRPLVVDTWRRARKLVPADRIWVVAPRALARELRRLLRDLGRKRLIVEPTGRDTAPAITLACATLEREAPGATVAIFPSDHVVRDERAFVRAVGSAVAAAREGALVCLGVRPDRPATGFGYLRCAKRPTEGEAIAVERFVEKPDVARARRYVASGRYLWNAGMFVWRCARFLDEVRRSAPQVVRAVEQHLEGRAGAWEKAPRISVDYAVMERARGVRVAVLDAGWDDVGSWDAAARLAEGAARRGEASFVLDSPGSVVFGRGRVVAILGVPGVAVIDTDDALLVVARESAEGVRRVVEVLERAGRKDLL